MLGGAHCGSGQSTTLVPSASTLEGEPAHPRRGKHPRSSGLPDSLSDNKVGCWAAPVLNVENETKPVS